MEIILINATHLQIFETNFSTAITQQEAISFVQNLSQGQKVYLKQVCTLVSLILVMPATNAASERSFFAMRRLKSYLRIKHSASLIQRTTRWLRSKCYS